MKKITLTTLLTFLILNNLTAVIYVRVNGNDSTGDGSTGNPYLTLSKAITQSRSGGDKTIILGSGYYWNTDVSLTTSDHGLTIKSESGTVILVGGQQIPSWTLSGTNYEYTLPSFPAAITTLSAWEPRLLIVNDRRANRSRYPVDTSTFLQFTNQTGQGTSSTMYWKGTDLSSFNTNYGEIEFRWIWDANMLRGVSISEANHTLSLSPSADYTLGYSSKTNYAVWNTREGLDKGRWYWDSVNNKIVYNPKTSEIISNAIVPTTSRIITFNGATNVTVNGITFMATTVPVVAAGFGAIRYDGAIYFDNNSRYVTITNCNFKNLAGWAMKGFKADHWTITGCKFENLGAGCVAFYNTATNNIVTNCWGKNIGMDYVGASHINVNGHTNTIIRCDFWTNGYAGVVIGGGMNNTVKYCRFVDNMGVLADGGNVYMWNTTNGIVEYNRMVYSTEYGSTQKKFSIYFDGTGGPTASSVARFNVVEGTYPVNVNDNSSSTPNTLTNNLFISTGALNCGFRTSPGVIYTRNIHKYKTTFTEDFTGQVSSWANNWFYSTDGNQSGVPSGGTYVNPYLVNYNTTNQVILSSGFQTWNVLDNGSVLPVGSTRMRLTGSN